MTDFELRFTSFTIWLPVLNVEFLAILSGLIPIGYNEFTATATIGPRVKVSREVLDVLMVWVSTRRVAMAVLNVTVPFDLSRDRTSELVALDLI